MNLYKASYQEFGRYCWYQEYQYVLWANTEEEALGLALEAQDDTKAEHWTIRELPKHGTHYISGDTG